MAKTALDRFVDELLAEDTAKPEPPSGEVWTCSGCGRRVPLTEETPEGRRRFVCPSGDGFISIPQEPGKPYIPSAKEQPFPPGKRDFLPRPLGQEANPDVWDAWTPFMLWLLEYHPDRYHEVCEAGGGNQDIRASRGHNRTGIRARLP